LRIGAFRGAVGQEQLCGISPVFGQGKRLVLRWN
jgi:hypothetical protein